MAITQGDPLPDITKTTTTEQQAPDYYTDYLTDLSKAGETALDLTGADLIEGYDPLQTTGYGMVEDAAGSYGDLMDLAETTGKTFGGIGATDISAFFDPYQTGVLNELDRLSAQNVQRNLLPGLKAGFVGSGGLGSQRYAGALGQSLADVELGLAGQRAGLMSKGYQDAIANAFKQAQEERQAAAAQGELATLAQTLGLREVDALTGAGAEKQAYEQSIIDAPLKTAMNVQAYCVVTRYRRPNSRPTLDRESRASTSNPIFPTSWEFFRLLVRRLEMFLMFNRARLVQLSWVAPDWQRSTKKQRNFLRTPTYLVILQSTAPGLIKISMTNELRTQSEDDGENHGN
jgi:hypothetical protein